MRRRDMIAVAGTLAAVAASGGAEAAGASAAPTLNLAGVALPVIVDGRLKNYVFVTVKLHLGAGATPEFMRTREPFFRDALVRAGHRAPFIVASDWTRLNETAITRAVLAAANVLAGEGAVTRVEIVSQTPRQRTGMRTR